MRNPIESVNINFIQNDHTGLICLFSGPIPEGYTSLNKNITVDMLDRLYVENCIKHTV